MPNRRLLVRSLLALAPLLVLGAATRAAATPRVVVLVEEHHGGSRAVAGGAEVRLKKALLDAGYPVVERFAAEQARSRISVERALTGDVAGLELTAVQADVLIAARVAVQAEPAPYGISTPVHGARLELRALAVDTGRVLHVDSLAAATIGDAAAAADKVAGQAAGKLLAALKSYESAATAIELRLSGMKHAKQADALAQQLGKLGGVESARVRVVAADATLIDLKGKALAMAALEEALGARGFVITRRTRDQLEARLDETSAARRPLTIARFKNATGKKDLDWIEQLLPEVIETELANSKYFVAGKARPTLDPDKPVAGEAHGELVLLGKVESAGPQLRLSVRAVRAKDGAVLATVQSFGAEGALAELGKDLVWKLDGPLYQKVFGKPSLEDYVAPLARRTHVPAAEGKVAAASKPAVARGPQVRIEQVRFGDLFPSRLGHYARHPLGRITLRNDGDEESRDARVTIDLGELSGGAQTLRAPPIAPGARVEVELIVVLERQRLLEVSQRRPIRAELTTSSGESRDRVTEPLVLWDRNALDWGQSDSVAAFVTPKDPTLLAFAQDAGRVDAPALPTAVRAAAQQFDAIVAHGVRYARDPLSPYGERAIDSVQFGRETLARKLGDCDDLAVLYAGLIEASGREARLLLTPGHILVGVDTELTAAQAASLGADRTLIVDGRVLIPVEITKLDGGFAAAWEHGIKEVARYRGTPGKLTTIDITRAWTDWPPFPLDTPQAAPAVDRGAVQKLLEADAVRLRSLDSAPAGKPLERATQLARRGALDEAQRLLAEIGRGGDQGLRGAAWNNLGNVETLRRSYGAARKSYGEAKRAGAPRATVLYNLAVVDYLEGRMDDAAKNLRGAASKEARQLAAQLGIALESKAAPAPTTPAPVDAAAGLRGKPSDARVEPGSALLWLGH